MSYVMEALQIVDYVEIMSGELESFCVDILEPQRLQFYGRFG